MFGLLRSVLEIFGVVFLRFRPISRLWCIWLVGINLMCLFFISHIEAQVVLAVTTLAVVVQALIYQRMGFTRLLGASHVLWLPMFAWLTTRTDSISADPILANWLLLLFATNLVSIVIDIFDGFRFLNGERMPHYHWKTFNRA